MTFVYFAIRNSTFWDFSVNESTHVLNVWCDSQVHAVDIIQQEGKCLGKSKKKIILQ